MAYDLKLAARIRTALAGRKDVVEKEMFGGIAFMVRGHMSCGVVGSNLMVRVDTADHEALVREPGARPMDFTGRPMPGFLYVEGLGTATTAALRRWVDRATAHAEAKPKKAKKSSPRRKTSRK